MNYDDERQRTLFCSNLHDNVTEDLMFELFLQAGPVEKVSRPVGKKFGFITFKHAESVPYTVELMNGIRLFGTSLVLKPREGSGGNTPQRQNSAAPFNGTSPGMPPSSPLNRSFSSPQFQSTPSNLPPRYQHGNGNEPGGWGGGGGGGSGRSTPDDRYDNQRQRDRDHRGSSGGRDRDRGRHEGRDYHRNRDRDSSRESSRDRSYDRRGSSQGHQHGYQRSDSVPSQGGSGGGGGLMGAAPSPMEAAIEMELRRQRVLQQQSTMQQHNVQLQFQQQMAQLAQQANQQFGGRQAPWRGSRHDGRR